jgi:hypothetical protein
MIRWKIKLRYLVSWKVWDVYVETDRSYIELHHGLNSERAICNAIDRFMDIKCMDNYFKTVSFTWELQEVHKAMLYDKMEI